MPQLSEKPRLGFSSKNPALHQVHEVCNSTTALGFRAALHLERIRSRYTGKERDTESGNDYFGARYYSSAMGRFLSPDWSAKVAPVPYAKLDNPQTLNLYAYVGNNPLSRRDLDGHVDIAAQCKGQATCNKTLVQTVNVVRQDKNGNSYVQSTLKVTTNFSLTTDAKGNVSASASSTVANAGGHTYSDSQLATMGKDIGTMQQAAVTMGFGQNTTQLVTSIGAAETAFGGDSGPTGKMNPATNPMQLVKGANSDLNHNVDGAMDVLDWAGRPSTFNPTATYSRYSDNGDTTMSNWDGSYKSITEQEK
jgi:RHS repeat-associated protein